MFEGIYKSKTNMKIWFGTIIVFLGILWVFSPVIGLSNDLGEEMAYIKVQSSIERLNLAYDRIRALERYEEKQQKEDQLSGKTMEAIVTAYNSLPEQTDSTPFITAFGTTVRSGIVANNCLPFKSRVQISGKTYTVEDRMNSRYGCKYFDIWFSTLKESREWGIKKLNIIIYESV